MGVRECIEIWWPSRQIELGVGKLLSVDVGGVGTVPIVSSGVPEGGRDATGQPLVGDCN